MNKKQHDMQLSINALHGAANGIASAIDNDSITSDQVFGLLTTIAKSMTVINSQPPQYLQDTKPDG